MGLEAPRWGRRPQVVAGGPNLHQILLKLSRFFSELSRLVMHVLACTHGWRLVPGITGVGRRPTPEPPAGARMKGA